MFDFCKDDIENFKEYMNRLDDNIQYSEANGFERMKESNEKIKLSIENMLSMKNVDID